MPTHVISLEFMKTIRQQRHSSQMTDCFQLLLTHHSDLQTVQLCSLLLRYYCIVAYRECEYCIYWAIYIYLFRTCRNKPEQGVWFFTVSKYEVIKSETHTLVHLNALPYQLCCMLYIFSCSRSLISVIWSLDEVFPSTEDLSGKKLHLQFQRFDLYCRSLGIWI